MTMNPDGSAVCDRCGADCKGGGVIDAVVVGDLDPDQPGHVINYHFCRDREDGSTVVKGCARKVLSARNLAHRIEAKEPQNGKPDN